MKKLLTIILILLATTSTAFAQDGKYGQFKKFFQKTVLKEKPNVMPETSDDEMTPSEQATLFYNTNESKKAFDVLLQIPEGKRSAQDWVLLGNILQDEEKTSDAIFMYQRAILIDEKYYKPYYNLGNIYLEDEKPFMAIENYRKANKSKNDFAYAYYNLGCAYLKVGNLSKAKIAFLKSIDIKNTEPDFYFNLAYTYKKLNKEKLSRQYLELYNKALSLKNDSQ